MSEFHYYKLFHDDQLGFIVKGYGDHPKSSVCYPMIRIVFLDSFPTEAEARIAFPQLAEGFSGWGSKILDDDMTRMPGTAPGWFDPADAGEVWGEDDY